MTCAAVLLSEIISPMLVHRYWVVSRFDNEGWGDCHTIEARLSSLHLSCMLVVQLHPLIYQEQCLLIDLLIILGIIIRE